MSTTGKRWDGTASRRRSRSVGWRVGAAAGAVLASATLAGGAVHAASEPDGQANATSWPRPWDPADGIDLTGAGATPEQEQRAAALIGATLEYLPQFADTATAYDLGYRSIGDASTGYEHYVNYALIADDVWLDPRQPESLVYRVDGAERTLVSAMFIVAGRALDDPELVDFGGPLMQWHVHDNLCWGGGSDGPRVVAVATDGICPANSVLGPADNPMVHVWIAPHECGPFAALEGHGAGQTAGGARTDQCVDDHDDHGGHGGHAEEMADGDHGEGSGHGDHAGH